MLQDKFIIMGKLFFEKYYDEKNVLEKLRKIVWNNYYKKVI